MFPLLTLEQEQTLFEDLQQGYDFRIMEKVKRIFLKINEKRREGGGNLKKHTCTECTNRNANQFLSFLFFENCLFEQQSLCKL